MNKGILAIAVTLLGIVASLRPGGDALGQQHRPHVLWIVAEDMSPHFGVYGETTIETPHIDRLAREGVLFENAFVTAPVCSPSRSALITGMYQATLGAHNHRSQGAEGKREAHSDYHESYEVPDEIELVPELFRDAGYYTTLTGPKLHGHDGYDGAGLNKSDYNFIWDAGAAYSSGTDWGGRRPGQPFFTQIQFSGGKERHAEVPDPVDPSEVHLPPYYPDHPVIRADWAHYLNAVKRLDAQVGRILERLEEEGLADNTAVIFTTDHGISHVRGKQFLYDEGLRVPLIIRWPSRLEAGTRRDDLVEHIDIAATSLDLAGIPVPEYMHGRALFSDGYTPRRFVYAARDRMDETVDVARAVRTKRYKYIRNYYTHRAHAQPNQYKDGKEITQAMRGLYREGKLDSVAASMFKPERPPEELYDLKKDPYETRSVAGDPAYRDVLRRMRRRLVATMRQTRDMGLIPEPILEELGLKHGSKYEAMQREDVRAQIPQIREVIRQGDDGDVLALVKAMQSPHPSVRYWAATGLGNLDPISEAALSALTGATRDASATVRVAASRAVFEQGRGGEKTLSVLARELENRNYLVRLYAMLALEEIGDDARPVQDRIEEKREGAYDYVRRVARRLTRTLEGAAEYDQEASLSSASGRAQADRIQPYENPRYWQYEDEPVLLLGGSRDDNLFQIPDLKEHLDLLASVGGNYIRNTMSSRDEGDVRAFKRLDDGRYDLDQWNEEYWRSFENLLKWTHERDIIVQIELWDQWDLNSGRWEAHPWNPENNINYSVSEVTLEGDGHYGNVSHDTPRHEHDFFLTVPALQDDRAVLAYQRKFVRKVLSHAFEYDHVLYTVTNELFEQHPPAWSRFWTEYVRERAAEAGKQIYVTEMFQHEDVAAPQHRSSLDHPDLFDYVELSQNASQIGQNHWEKLQWVRHYTADAPRPINHTKIYGSDEVRWTNGTAEGIERFWRNIIGGAASVRFHRPPSGIGLSKRAQTQLKSARMLTSELDVFRARPDVESTLLSDRAPDEAYLTYIPSEQYALYFPAGEAVQLDLSDGEGTFILKWLDVENSQWQASQTVQGGGMIALEAPGSGNWVVLLTKTPIP